MLNDLNTPPVEMSSVGFEGSNAYGDEQEPAIAGEKLHDLILYNDSAGESFAMKVRLYSLDVNKPGAGYAASCTVSLGKVDAEPCADILIANFKQLKLRTDKFIVTMHKDNIDRVSYTEEDGGTCSLILDVSLPGIVKLELGE